MRTLPVWATSRNLIKTVEIGKGLARVAAAGPALNHSTCLISVLQILKMSKEEGEGTSAEEEQTIQQWKVKKLIQRLQSARGNGTSMISLIIPPKDQVSRYTKMLGALHSQNLENFFSRISPFLTLLSS